MELIQQEQYWKEDFIDYSIHLIINEPKEIHSAIFLFGAIAEHLEQPIVCGTGYVLEKPEEYFFYIELMQGKLNELKKIIDDTDI